MKWVLLFAAGFGTSWLAFQVAGALTKQGSTSSNPTAPPGSTPVVSGGFSFSAYYITIPALAFVWWKFGLLEAVDFGAGEIFLVFFGIQQISSHGGL